MRQQLYIVVNIGRTEIHRTENAAIAAAERACRVRTLVYKFQPHMHSTIVHDTGRERELR